MKKKSFFTVAILFLSGPAFSQQASDSLSKNSYWSLSYSFGFSGVIENDNDKRFADNEGRFTSVELSYIPENSSGIFINYSMTTFQSPLINYELTSGVKFYTKDKKLFFSAGGGYYDLEQRAYSWYNWYEESKIQGRVFPGLNVGAGGRVRINNSFGAIVKGRMHFVFSGNGAYVYAGLNAGLEVYGSRQSGVSNVKNKNKKMSTGFVAGGIMKTNSKPSAGYGAEFTYSVSEKVSLIGNYLHNNERHYIGDVYSPITENDYSGGFRFYTNEGSAKFFVESLLDLNVYTLEIDSFFGFPPDKITSKSLGLALGVGSEFELTENFSGMVKASITKFDEPGSAQGMFGGLRYSF